MTKEYKKVQGYILNAAKGFENISYLDFSEAQLALRGSENVLKRLIKQRVDSTIKRINGDGK